MPAVTYQLINVVYAQMWKDGSLSVGIEQRAWRALNLKGTSDFLQLLLLLQLIYYV